MNGALAVAIASSPSLMIIRILVKLPDYDMLQSTCYSQMIHELHYSRSSIFYIRFMTVNKWWALGKYLHCCFIFPVLNHFSPCAILVPLKQSVRVSPINPSKWRMKKQKICLRDEESRKNVLQIVLKKSRNGSKLNGEFELYGIIYIHIYICYVYIINIT